ncbi:unnamed protein product [Rangifer tarandus platyrhynchus]|uniref:Uncharacterized protein n=2 Tax=Rangifer tarandus platyrhynchus TaxID=3082113 RepID=A0AC59Y6E8_RANTA|nr:unnamed protein product [Rangifer tarandus platyrhynchus]
MHDRSEQEPHHPEAACHFSQGSAGPSRSAALTAPWPPHPGFPGERGQAGQEWPPPSSTAKNVLDSTLPALHPLPTSPHSSLSPRNTHTCTHTPQPLFHTAHLSSQAPLWLPGLEGTPGSSGSPLLTQNCRLDAFHKIPAKTSPSSSCTPPRTGSSLPPKPGFSLDRSDISISSVHARGFCFPVVLSMSCHVLSLCPQV